LSKSRGLDRKFGIDQYGRHRTLIKRGDIAIIPGARTESQWLEMLRQIEQHARQMNLSVGQVDDFYRGWVEPLVEIQSDYCGHKMTNIAANNNVAVLKINDLMDLALNTGIIETLLPGSTVSAYGGGTERMLECPTCKNSFRAEHFPLDSYKVGLKLLSDGDFMPFSLSMIGWESIYRLTEKRMVSMNTTIEGVDVAVVNKATQRLAELCTPVGDESYSALPIHVSYSNPRETYDVMTRFVGDEDAAFLTLLQLTQAGEYSGYEPTEQEIELIADDEYVRKLIGLLRNAAPQKHWRGTPPKYGFHLLMQAAAFDIDYSMLDSLSEQNA